MEDGRLGTKTCYFIRTKYFKTEIIDFQLFLLKESFRSNGKLLQPKITVEKWTKKARRKLPQPLRPQLGMCVCGETMAWGGDEMEGNEFWLGNARGRDGKRRHRRRQRDVV
jgi:hypothetical protein